MSNKAEIVIDQILGC